MSPLNNTILYVLAVLQLCLTPRRMGYSILSLVSIFRFGALRGTALK